MLLFTCLNRLSSIVDLNQSMKYMVLSEIMKIFSELSLDICEFCFVKYFKRNILTSLCCLHSDHYGRNLQKRAHNWKAMEIWSNIDETLKSGENWMAALSSPTTTVSVRKGSIKRYRFFAYPIQSGRIDYKFYWYSLNNFGYNWIRVNYHKDW